MRFDIYTKYTVAIPNRIRRFQINGFYKKPKYTRPEYSQEILTLNPNPNPKP